MRVLFAPIDIAGQARLTAIELEKRGHYARFYDGYASYLGYEYENGQQYALDTLPSLMDFDIFDVFFGAFRPISGTAPKHLKFVHHFCGSDVRQYDIAIQHNPYAKVKGFTGNAEKIRENLKGLATLTSHCTIMDEELRPHVAPYFENVHIVPRMIDFDRYQKITTTLHEIPRIVHAPTHATVKGTDYIVKAAQELNLPDFMLVAGMKHNVAENIYANSDIIVAQLNLDSYGILAIEGMAMGKVVITYLSDKMRSTYPEGLPIISATRENIKEVLAEVSSWPLEKRKAIGQAGIEYVRKYHTPDVIIPKLLEVYKSL